MFISNHWKGILKLSMIFGKCGASKMVNVTNYFINLLLTSGLLIRNVHIRGYDTDMQSIQR